jgi:hypothetical protein
MHQFRIGATKLPRYAGWHLMYQASRTGAALAVARHIAAQSIAPTVIDVEEEEEEDARKKQPPCAAAAQAKVKVEPKSKTQINFTQVYAVSQVVATSAACSTRCSMCRLCGDWCSMQQLCSNWSVQNAALNAACHNCVAASAASDAACVNCVATGAAGCTLCSMRPLCGNWCSMQHPCTDHVF